MKFAILFLLSVSAQAAEYTYQKCANEDAICKFTGTKVIRYGARNKFVQKSLKGPVNCNNKTFGDPIRNVFKFCHIRNTVQAPAPVIPAASVSITAPVNGSSPLVKSSINVSANASNAVKVSFYANNVLICEKSAAPYSCPYVTPANAGAVSIKAVAINSAKAAVEKSVSINVIAASVPAASVSITSPAAGSSPLVKTSINVSANASNAVKVSFYANNVLICEKSAAPYSCPYITPASAGAVSIKAVAVNSAKASVEKSVSINVTAASVPVVPPTPTPNPDPTPVPTGGFPVYSGCSAPSSSYGRKVVLDGNKGEYLQDAFSNGTVQPGDEVVVKGPQKSFTISKANASNWMNANAWTKIDGKDAIFENIEIRHVGKIHMTNFTVSNLSKAIVYLLEANNIIVSDSKLYGALDSSKWTAQNWINAPHGILSDNSRCISLLRNKISNLRSGLTFNTRGTTSDTVVIRGLGLDNEIRNISGDFMRPLGSEVILKGNKAYDGYVGAADGDGNHDDFIQGFSLNGVTFNNVQIIDNFFQETTNYKRPFIADYQGIAIFDGVYSNFVIRGNTVIGGAYHGITVMGGDTGSIENNTILSSRPDLSRKYWIATPVGKKGQPSLNITVKNNIANTIKDVTGVTVSNNVSILPADVSKHLMKFDLSNASFDLRIRSDSPYYNKNIGDQTPN